MVNFTQKHPFDTELIGLIKQRLDIDINPEMVEFLPAGYTGGVHKVGELVIKKVNEETDWNIYQEIIKPFNLRSPKMYGLFKTSSGLYIVMDYIPHELKLNDKERLEKAVDYLVEKDTTILNSLDKIKRSADVGQSVRDSAEYFISRLEKYADKNVHSTLTTEFAKTIREDEYIFHQAAEELMKGQLTLVHNDFQMKNLLFSDEDNKLFVIDWSNPNIGSVTLDLAKLVLLGPNNFEDGLVKRYREKIEFPEFDECWEMAKLRVALTVYEWNIEVLAQGFKESVREEEIIKLYQILSNKLS